MRNRLATRDNLKARNLVIEGYDFSCPFCNSVEESVWHTLFWCTKVEDIWKTCYGWANVLTVLPSSPDMHFRQHQLQTNNVVNSRWQIFWYGVVWNFRNKPVFRDISSHKDEIIQQVLYHSWTWIKNSSEISIVLCSMILCSMLASAHGVFALGRLQMDWLDFWSLVVKNMHRGYRKQLCATLIWDIGQVVGN